MTNSDLNSCLLGRDAAVIFEIDVIWLYVATSFLTSQL